MLNILISCYKSCASVDFTTSHQSWSFLNKYDKIISYHESAKTVSNKIKKSEYLWSRHVSILSTGTWNDILDIDSYAHVIHSTTIRNTYEVGYHFEVVFRSNVNDYDLRHHLKDESWEDSSDVIRVLFPDFQFILWSWIGTQCRSFLSVTNTSDTLRYLDRFL